MIEVIGLDAWSTLIEFSPERNLKRGYFLAPILELMQAHGVTFETNDEFYDLYRQTKILTEKFSELTGTHIGPLERHYMLAMGLGIGAEQLDQNLFRKTSKEYARRSETMLPVLLEPNLADTFAAVKASGRKLAIVSNLGMISAGFMRTTFKELGVGDAFDFELYSDETGFCKPNPKVFSKLCELANCKPENILFIGDNKHADFDGPQKFGMQAVHISQESDAEYYAPNVTQALKLMGIID